MTEPLVTEFGRRDRSAITARAQWLHRNAPMEWDAAMKQAHREASNERHSTVPLRDGGRA